LIPDSTSAASSAGLGSTWANAAFAVPLTGFPSGQDWIYYDVVRVDDRYRSSMKLDEVYEMALRKSLKKGEIIFHDQLKFMNTATFLNGIEEDLIKFYHLFFADGNLCLQGQFS
jgi:hypothetical protein